jgi:hypothetical protein
MQSWPMKTGGKRGQLFWVRRWCGGLFDFSFLSLSLSVSFLSTRTDVWSTCCRRLLLHLSFSFFFSCSLPISVILVFVKKRGVGSCFFFCCCHCSRYLYVRTTFFYMINLLFVSRDILLYVGCFKDKFVEGTVSKARYTTTPTSISERLSARYDGPATLHEGSRGIAMLVNLCALSSWSRGLCIARIHNDMS